MYNGNSTWNKPSGIKRIWVMCTGGGGGGSGYTGGSGSYTTSNVGTFAGDENDVPSQATNSGYLSSGVSKGGEYNVTNASSGANHAGGHGKVVLVFIAPI